ncbi:MAG: gamma carbonic anhydrase family protein, partial [Gammaproteobacteria bacterium]|nr:gamma carbonic anhydrase family protein [Gammaproteobacteria bacterium]
MMIRRYQDKTPAIGDGSYIDESAVVIGNVVIGKNCSVWPLTVIRADINKIRIGDSTNIQDGSVLHVTHRGDYSP